MNRPQQILGIKKAVLTGDDRAFTIAIERLIASARLDGAYNPERAFKVHRETRKARRS